MSITRVYAALAMLSAAFCANAQSTLVGEARQQKVQSHKYVHFGEGKADSIEHARLIEQFYNCLLYTSDAADD